MGEAYKTEFGQEETVEMCLSIACYAADNSHLYVDAIGSGFEMLPSRALSVEIFYTIWHHPLRSVANQLN